MIKGITMKTNKLSILISVFNLFLIAFLFLGTTSGENGIAIGKHCWLTEDGSNFKIIYDGTTRLVLNNSDGSITAGSVQGTGENSIYSSSLTANTISGSLNSVPEIELESHSGTEFEESKAYIYQKSGKLILGFMDESGTAYYYWADLASGGDINNWTFSLTEP
jgi:hypothetical protein